MTIDPKKMNHNDKPERRKILGLHSLQTGHIETCHVPSQILYVSPSSTHANAPNPEGKNG